MAKIDLSKYGISGTTEIVHNPSYELLFEEETKPELEGYEKGQVSELGAIQKILYGGHLMNIRMITILQHRKLGTQ